MESMMDIIKDEERRKGVVADTVDLISSEVRSKTGIGGFALKAGYSVVRRLKGGRMISHAADHLIDEMAEAIEPLHAQFRSQSRTANNANFQRFLENNSNAAVEALLSVTDSHAQKSEKGLLLKTYRKLRPVAERHVRAALPGLGMMIQKHTA